MNSLDNKIVIYDGNCKLCSSGAKLTLEFSKFPKENLSSYDDLNEALQPKVNFELFRNEMAVIDKAGLPTLYGFEGVLFVLSCKFPFLGRIKRSSLLFSILNVFYKIVAYNRYVLFPVNSTIKCSCEPPFNGKYRVILFSISLTFSLLFSAAFGATLSRHLDSSAQTAIFYTLVAVGTGWTMQMISAILFLRGEQLLNYFGHLGLIMVTGQLILIPGMLTFFLHSLTFYSVTAICVVVSFIVMMRMHFKRTKILGMKISWNFSLIFFLQLSVMLTIWYLTK